MSRYNNRDEQIETTRKTSIETNPRNGCKIPLVRGCMVPILVGALTVIAVRECKRSGIRLEQDQIKLQQILDSAAVKDVILDATDSIYVMRPSDFQKTR